MNPKIFVASILSITLGVLFVAIDTIQNKDPQIILNTSQTGGITVDVDGTQVLHGDSALCEIDDRPDSHTRAFRDANGNTNILSLHFENYRYIGQNLNDAKRDCNTKLLSSSKDADYTKHNDHEWLNSFYTLDGQTIYAIIHNEYHGWKRHNCNPVVNCWWNSLTSAISTNGGRTYTHTTPPNHVIFESKDNFNEKNTQEIVGYFEPSNIIKKDGYYYMMVFHTALPKNDPNLTGRCLARTNNLANPDSWKLWDGNGFNLTGDKTVCTPLPNAHHHHISYNTYFQKYLSLGCHPTWGECRFSLSDDLITWQAAGTFILPSMQDGTYSNYASLLDPGDPTRNYEQTGRSPWLYFSVKSGNRPVHARTRIRFNNHGINYRSPILNLEFNEWKPGPALDASFNKSNATTDGATVQVNEFNNTAYRKLAAGQTITVANKQNLNPPTDFTVQIHLKTTDKNKQLFAKGNQFKADIDNNGKLVFKFGSTTLKSNKTISNGQWTPIQINKNGNKIDLFFDSQLDNSITIEDVPTINNNNPLTIGGNINMDIDWFRIFNFAIPLQQNATPTGSPIPTTPAVGNTISCGSLDENNDQQVNILDFSGFKDTYVESVTNSKKCKTETIQNPCGPKDSNSDSLVNISDFPSFIESYREEGCG